VRRWLVVWCAVLALSCGGTESTRRTFPLVVAPSAGAPVTDSGWAVTLSSARVSLEAARFFAGEVPSLTRRAPSRRLVDWLMPSAWAHPGHDVPGAAMGELLSPVDVDLLQPETAWGEVRGVTGRWGSLELTLGAAGVRLAGTATKGGLVVSFDTGRFTPPGPVRAIAFAHQVDASPGRARLTVDLGAILSRVDFGQVGAQASPLDVSSPAFNGFARGVEDSSAWRGAWERQ
jgi:hypothetical protein